MKNILPEPSLHGGFAKLLRPQTVRKGEMRVETLFMARAVHRKEFLAIVQDGSKLFRTKILFENEPYIKCTCPKETGGCAHIYAALKTIDMGRYDIVDFEPLEDVVMPKISEVIRVLPNGILESYVNERLSAGEIITPMDFARTFAPFLPEKEYAFFHARFYNEIVFHQYALMKMPDLMNGTTVMMHDHEGRVFLGNSNEFAAARNAIEDAIRDEHPRFAFKLVSAMVDATIEAGERGAFLETLDLDTALARIYQESPVAFKRRITSWARKYRFNRAFNTDKELLRIVDFHNNEILR